MYQCIILKCQAELVNRAVFFLQSIRKFSFTFLFLLRCGTRDRICKIFLFWIFLQRMQKAFLLEVLLNTPLWITNI